MTPISITPGHLGIGYDVWIRVTSTLSMSLDGSPTVAYTDHGPRFAETLAEAALVAMTWWPEATDELHEDPPVSQGALAARADDVRIAINTLTEA